MEYQLVAGVRVAIPQAVADAGDVAAYVAADDDGRSAILGPLQTAEAERVAQVVEGEIPPVIVEA